MFALGVEHSRSSSLYRLSSITTEGGRLFSVLFVHPIKVTVVERGDDMACGFVGTGPMLLGGLWSCWSPVSSRLYIWYERGCTCRSYLSSTNVRSL